MDRREVLECGTKMAAIGSLGSWAGCLQQSQSSSERSIQVPETKEPTYREWLPSLSEVEAIDGYDVHYESISELRANSHLGEQDEFTDWLIQERLTRAEERWNDFGLTLADVDEVVKIYGINNDTSISPRAYIVRGSYHPDQVASTLAENGFNATEAYREYQVYRSENPPRTTGISDDAIVYVKASNPTTLLRRIVDAEHGETSRRHEADDDFARLTEEVGRPTFGMVLTHEETMSPNPDHLLFEGGVGNGQAWMVTDSTVYSRYALLFESESKTEPQKVREVMEDNDRPSRSEISTEGRIVFVDGVTEYSQ